MSEGNDLSTMVGWVKELRRRVGISQSQLAERVGLTTNSVSLIEMGWRCPSRPVLILMRQTSDLIGMPPPPACEYRRGGKTED